MLYNISKKKIQRNSDCLNCKYYNTITRKCSGINLECFEYDENTNTIIDNTTKMPLNIEKKESDV